VLLGTRVLAHEYYQIIKETPEYPFGGNIIHYENKKAMESYRETSERKAIEGEIEAWTKRGIVDYFWRAAYELTKSIRSGPVSAIKETTIVENAPFIHVEAYLLSSERLFNIEKPCF
jgi:hypothetical protein